MAVTNTQIEELVVAPKVNESDNHRVTERPISEIKEGLRLLKSLEKPSRKRIGTVTFRLGGAARWSEQ